MSKESATQFLRDATNKMELRDKFKEVADAREFIQVASQLGYDFTTEELKEVVTEHSQGITVRRHTGVWPWLRTVPWR
jgi:predicted ribosomally synthesized peptide with nif11-like leader